MMGDIKLFKIENGNVSELEGSSAAVERSLQSLIETHMEEFLGITLLESEFSTGRTHRGRIDSLGIDENGSPVIIEYKRSINENVINQGLFYLDWLLDHKAEFKLLVMNKLGNESAENIEWDSSRLLCIAGDFTRYDEHAVQQIDRNIELIRYRRYGDGLLLLELVNATTAGQEPTTPARRTSSDQKTITEVVGNLQGDLKDRFEALKDFLMSLGDDVQMKTLKFYIAFKRIKNFACVEVRPQQGTILVYAKLDPESIDLIDGFTRDVRTIGHYGTGDVEIIIRSDEDFERAKPLLVQSYDAS
jgi:predicted transport protein